LTTSRLNINNHSDRCLEAFVAATAGATRYIGKEFGHLRFTLFFILLKAYKTDFSYVLDSNESLTEWTYTRKFT